ncbi:hypothetical protein KI387_036953, partial [Taxus chinensis]
IPKVAEREEIEAIETLEEEKLKRSVEPMLNKEKEESAEKDHGKNGGPILTI